MPVERFPKASLQETPGDRTTATLIQVHNRAKLLYRCVAPVVFRTGRPESRIQLCQAVRVEICRQVTAQYSSIRGRYAGRAESIPNRYLRDADIHVAVNIGGPQFRMHGGTSIAAVT